MNPITESIDTCKYLCLHHIGEPDENALRLVVAEAAVGDPPDAKTLALEPTAKIRELLSDSRTIIHGPGCRVFEIVWPSYIGYSVRNESFARPEPTNSQGKGRLFVEYTKSAYLDYLSSTTWASSDYPGTFKHWTVHCLNHVVDVASTDEPVITVTACAHPQTC